MSVEVAVPLDQRATTAGAGFQAEVRVLERYPFLIQPSPFFGLLTKPGPLRLRHPRCAEKYSEAEKQQRAEG